MDEWRRIVDRVVAMLGVFSFPSLPVVALLSIQRLDNNGKTRKGTGSGGRTTDAKDSNPAMCVRCGALPSLALARAGHCAE